MSNITTILYLTQAVNYVIHQGQNNLINHTVKNTRTFYGPSKRMVNQNIKAHNKRYSQVMNRRKHQIKQPGVDVQRKNIYRKGRN